MCIARRLTVVEGPVARRRGADLRRAAGSAAGPGSDWCVWARHGRGFREIYRRDAISDGQCRPIMQAGNGVRISGGIFLPQYPRPGNDDRGRLRRLAADPGSGARPDSIHFRGAARVWDKMRQGLKSCLRRGTGHGTMAIVRITGKALAFGIINRQGDMRSGYWDGWKGIAIVAVIAIHASGSATGSEPGSLNQQFGIWLRQLINFPVAMFIFLSAYFTHQPSARAPEGMGWLGRRLWRLILPYLVWSVVYTLFRIVTGVFYPEELPLRLATGTVILVGYFVIVMVQLSIVSIGLDRLTDRAICWLLPVAVGMSVAFTYGVRLLAPGSFWAEFPYNALPFIVWLPFYILGMIAARPVGRRLAAVAPSRFAILFLISVGLAVAEAMMLRATHLDLAISQLKPSSMLASASLCLFAVAWHAKAGETVLHSRVLSWLGRRSYYFYLSHMLVLLALQKVLGKVALIHGFQPLSLFLTAGLTLLICAAGAGLFDRLFAAAPKMRRALGLT
ncbi:acyltransferase [Paenirhodobacter populi]|nr:acyltransferase [Sinirhodobacter populi]